MPFDQNNLDSTVDNFLNAINLTIDHFCPIITKTFRDRNTDNPWCSSELKSLIKEKNKLFSKFIKRPLTFGDSYRRLRNKVNNMIKSQKKYYYQNKLCLFRSDTKKKWQVINELLNRTSNEGVSEIFVDGTLTNDKQLIADKFNQYFSGIPTEINSNLPPPNVNFETYLSGSFSSSFFLRPMNIEELIKLISELNDTGGGFLQIPPKVLKSNAQVLSGTLCDIYNLCISKGYFPKKFKISQVTPVFKGGDKQCISNYRPISILSPFSKLFEKFIYKQLMHYFETKDILRAEQGGFRAGCTTDVSIGKLLQFIVSDVDGGRFGISLFLDFQKAFDLIDRKILLKKLYFYGVRGITYDLLCSFLTDRYQYVQVEDKKSMMTRVDMGVVQGSIMGPLLFIIFINDLLNCSQILKFNLFADDTCVYFGHSSLPEVYRTFNEELPRVADWILANSLSLNVNKTVYMLFSGKKKVHNLPTLVVLLKEKSRLNF